MNRWIGPTWHLSTRVLEYSSTGRSTNLDLAQAVERGGLRIISESAGLEGGAGSKRPARCPGAGKFSARAVGPDDSNGTNRGIGLDLHYSSKNIVLTRRTPLHILSIFPVFAPLLSSCGLKTAVPPAGFFLG